MKTAFTLLELIFSIVVIGIAGVTASLSFNKDTLIPATMQVLDHIRYTQQLALNQDMFTPAPEFSFYNDSAIQSASDSRQWFKKWWQIQFHNDTADDTVSYSIYSDHPSSTNGVFSNKPEYGIDPKKSDIIARDPQSRLYIFSSTYSCSTGGAVACEERLDLVDLKNTYDVKVAFNGCASKHILFDQLGRPHCMNGSGIYPYSEILKTPVKITLTASSGESSAICITPITGYAYISTNGSCP